MQIQVQPYGNFQCPQPMLALVNIPVMNLLYLRKMEALLPVGSHKAGLLKILQLLFWQFNPDLSASDLNDNKKPTIKVFTMVCLPINPGVKLTVVFPSPKNSVPKLLQLQLPSQQHLLRNGATSATRMTQAVPFVKMFTHRLIQWEHSKKMVSKNWLSPSECQRRGLE